MTNIQLPIHLQIEPSQICNLQCIGCSRTEVHKGRKLKTLTLEDFKTIISHTPSVKDISLHGLGEPFYNDDLAKIAVFLNKKGIAARIVSNGNYDNPNIDKVLLLENLQEICFSIDGDNKATYESIRLNGDFEKFKEIVSCYHQLRIKNKITSCILSFNCVISSKNINDVSEIPKIAKELGIDKIKFNFLGQFFYSEKDGDYNEIEELKATNKEVLRELIIHLKKKCKELNFQISHPVIGKKRNIDCFWPLRAAFITAEGFVTPCNYRMNPEIISFGNILTQTMKEIWYSKDYLEFRENFIKKKYYSFCLTCD